MLKRFDVEEPTYIGKFFDVYFAPNNFEVMSYTYPFLAKKIHWQYMKIFHEMFLSF